MMVMGSICLRLTKFVLLLTDDEHRARSGTHDPLRGAPDAEMFPAGVAVGRDHDEVYVGLPRGFDDLMRGNAGPDFPIQPTCVSRALAGGHLAELSFRRCKIDFGKSDRAGNRRETSRGQWLEDVKQGQLGAKLLRTTQGILEAVLRG